MSVAGTKLTAPNWPMSEDGLTYRRTVRPPQNIRSPPTSHQRVMERLFEKVSNESRSLEQKRGVKLNCRSSILGLLKRKDRI